MDIHALDVAQPPAGPETSAERLHPPPRRLAEPRIATALQRIEDANDTGLTLDALAADAGLSPFHFHRLFVDVMGEAPGAYVRRTRLDSAAVQLQRGEDPVTALAGAVGYGSAAAFSRAFQRQFGHTPQAFRAHARRNVPQPQPIHFARAAGVRVQQQPMRVAFTMRFHGGYHRIEDAWREFADALRAHGVDPDALTVAGLVRDSPEIVASELIRYDCAVFADHGWTPPPGLAMARRELLPRRRALVDHDAPYYDVFDAYKTLVWGWLPTSGEHIAASPTLELYREPPWRNAGGTQRLTVACALR